MGVDFDKLIELFNDLGLSTRWLSKKDTAKSKQKEGGKSIVVVNQQAITFKMGEQDALIGGGIMSKILYDCIRPSNMVFSIRSAHGDKFDEEISPSTE